MSKQIKIKCLNCGREEYCEYGIAVNRDWKCICGSTIWEMVE